MLPNILKAKGTYVQATHGLEQTMGRAEGHSAKLPKEVEDFPRL